MDAPEFANLCHKTSLEGGSSNSPVFGVAISFDPLDDFHCCCAGIEVDPLPVTAPLTSDIGVRTLRGDCSRARCCGVVVSHTMTTLQQRMNRGKHFECHNELAQ